MTEKPTLYTYDCQKEKKAEGIFMLHRNHSFHDTEITTYPQNAYTLGKDQQISAHESLPNNQIL